MSKRYMSEILTYPQFVKQAYASDEVKALEAKDRKGYVSNLWKEYKEKNGIKTKEKKPGKESAKRSAYLKYKEEQYRRKDEEWKKMSAKEKRDYVSQAWKQIKDGQVNKEEGEGECC